MMGGGFGGGGGYGGGAGYGGYGFGGGRPGWTSFWWRLRASRVQKRLGPSRLHHGKSDGVGPVCLPSRMQAVVVASAEEAGPTAGVAEASAEGVAGVSVGAGGC